MSLPPPFSSTVRVKSTHSTAPSLALTASATLPPCKSTLLASSKLELRVRVQMVAGGGEEKEEEDMNMKILLESALLREVKGWFEKHKGSLNLDSAGVVSLSSDTSSVIIPLHSYTRSAMCARLSIPRKTTQSINGNFNTTWTTSAGLQAVDLLFTFSPASDPSQSPSSSVITGPLSRAIEIATLAETISSPSTLHFTVSPLVSGGLARVAQKLAAAFPLCFNTRWIERLSNDLSSHSAIAGSLSKILNGLPRGSELDTKATLLRMRLSTHLQLNYDSPVSTSAPSTSTDAPPPDDLISALLLLAQSVPKHDPWRPVDASGSNVGQLSGSLTSNKSRQTKQVRAEDGDDEGLVSFAASDEEEDDEGEDDTLAFDDEDAGTSDIDFEEDFGDSARSDAQSDGVEDQYAEAPEEEEAWLFAGDDEGVIDGKEETCETGPDGDGDGAAMELEMYDE